MKKILIDDFEIEKNDWGYYFTANINFLGQNSELLLNYDTEDEVSEIELKDILYSFPFHSINISNPISLSTSLLFPKSSPD